MKAQVKGAKSFSAGGLSKGRKLTFAPIAGEAWNTKTLFSPSLAGMFSGTKVREPGNARQKIARAGQELGPGDPSGVSRAQELGVDAIPPASGHPLKVPAHLMEQLGRKLTLEDRMLAPLSVELQDSRTRFAYGSREQVLYYIYTQGSFLERPGET